MNTFNEYLSYFLTDCRNNALEELRFDKHYAERKQTQAAIRSKLEALISSEAVKLLEEYSEAGVVLQGIEYNRVILCGLTTMSEIQKRLDVSTPEYKAFAEEYLS